MKSVNFSNPSKISDLKGISKTLHNHSMTEQSKTLNGGLSMSIGGGSTMKQSLLARVAHLNHSMYENFNKKKESTMQTINSQGSKSLLPTQADSQTNHQPALPQIQPQVS